LKKNNNKEDENNNKEDDFLNIILEYVISSVGWEIGWSALSDDMNLLKNLFSNGDNLDAKRRPWLVLHE